MGRSSGRASLALLRLRWAVEDACAVVTGIMAIAAGLVMWLVWSLRWPLAVAFLALLALVLSGGAR